MLKRINKINNFGVFKDFLWGRNPSLRDFNEKNILYGWNYSGKTTISRIFSSLRDKQIHNDYSDGYFEIICDQDTFSSNELDKFNYSVLVFNKEYIEDNLSWDKKNSKWEPISFDVGGNVDIRKKIDENNFIIERINGSEKNISRIKLHQQKVDDFTIYETKKFTDISAKIRENIFNKQIEFDKGHFKRIRDSFVNDVSTYIISDINELNTLKKIAVSTKILDDHRKIEFIPAFLKLKTEVEKLLHEEPPKDIVIDILENNKELYDWTKQGLEFKENKSECAFCGNKVTSDRLKKLNDYFSNASKILRDNISELYKLIDAEINSFEKMSIPKSKNDFVESIQENIEEQIKAFDQIKTDYKSSLLSLKVELARKEDGNIFTSININYIESTEVLLENWITKTNEYIETHNEFNKNYEDEKTNAQNKLKEHYIAHFLIDEDYYDKEHQAFYEKRCVERYRRISGRLKSENESLQNQLKTITIGKEKLNELIQKFLDTSFIKIDVTDDDKFLLKRGDKYAVNLSEGEKTAIAFSYFLIVLESLLKNNKLMDTIIFIDDPISSLDNNHIAQLYSLINSFFFRKGINTDSPEQVVNCFKQLFLSTHNFEFFSFLKDSNKINKKNSCNYYLIKRISEEESSIVDIPKSLSLYKSEYILLFEIIYNYHISEDKENNENTILLPNAVRRFLEIYTLMKIPHENASVETRINSLVGDTNEFKFLNHFSHFTSFEKLTKHDELIMILPKAVNELIKLLKNDFKHFESLKKAININQ